MRVLVVVMVLLLVACGPGPTPSPNGAAEPVIAFDEQGPFRLELEFPKATYAAGEEIEALARLRFAGPGAIEVAGPAGGLISFSLKEVDGPRGAGFFHDDACAAYGVDAADPYTGGLVKSGATFPGDPNRAFIEAFLDDPVYRLPAGTWDISAWSSFLGKGCNQPETELSTNVRIVVTD